MSIRFNKKAMIFSAFLLPAIMVSTSAQVTKSERLLSFEDASVPQYVHCSKSAASISDIHYRDGMHALEWNYKAGAVLSIQKDLKFERRIPGDRDLYLSAFVV